MPISEDIRRELSLLFAEVADDGADFIDVTAPSLLGRIERWREDCDVEGLSGRLAVCQSVLLSRIDLTCGDRVLEEDAEELVIRFVLPRRWQSAA
jgi:hypothetical protein